MSGHSHWSSIKHKKAQVDSRRGRLWSKLARNIIVAARSGGGNPSENLSLRYAIDKAKEANMPKDTIEKAIKKGTGDLEGVNFEEVVYEGYAAGGVAVMCDALTDNRNRTAGEIRKIFDSRGGSLGGTGCVAWLFTKRGVIVVDAANATEDRVMEVALDAGADDVQVIDNGFEVACAPEMFEKIKQVLLTAGFTIQRSEISQIPSTYVTVTDETVARKLVITMETLEDHEDIQNVYSNFDIPEEVVKKMNS